jgi:hypothetical protein
VEAKAKPNMPRKKTKEKPAKAKMQEEPAEEAKMKEESAEEAKKRGA